MKIKHVFIISNIMGFATYMAVKYGIYAGYAIVFPMYVAATVSGIVGFLLLLRMEETAIDEKFHNETMMFRPKTISEFVEEMKSEGKYQVDIDVWLEVLKTRGEFKDGYVYERKPIKDTINSTKIIGFIGIASYVSILPQTVIAAMDALTYMF